MKERTVSLHSVVFVHVLGANSLDDPYEVDGEGAAKNKPEVRLRRPNTWPDSTPSNSKLGENWEPDPSRTAKYGYAL